MARADLLTEDEYRRFDPSRVILRSLEECRLSFGLSRAETTVLDFGCGRGRLLCFLHEQGYNVFGVDPDEAALAAGRDLLRRHHVDVDERVTLIRAGETLPFADQTFHFVVSDQVLEHVEQLEPVALELARVTRVSGAGLHRFPSRLRFFEPHLGLPLVHWLPKTRVRKGWIALLLLLGADPGWTRGGPVSARAGMYYRYGVEHTYYRSTRAIKAELERAGFSVRRPPGVARSSIARARAWWRLRFKSVVLLTTKS
jgi:SAM-dependent methyltransferase